MPVPATGKVVDIDEQIYARLRNNNRDRIGRRKKDAAYSCRSAHGT